jgi:hypothetical protein
METTGLMPVETIHCVVADTTKGIVYDVAADYREWCPHAHDSRRVHLCELTLRARPMQEPDMSSTACDIAAVPTPVLVAIQTKLRALLE